jgi:hypothetical protein
MPLYPHYTAYQPRDRIFYSDFDHFLQNSPLRLESSFYGKRSPIERIYIHPYGIWASFVNSRLLQAGGGTLVKEEEEEEGLDTSICGIEVAVYPVSRMPLTSKLFLCCSLRKVFTAGSVILFISLLAGARFGFAEVQSPKSGVVGMKDGATTIIPAANPRAATEKNTVHKYEDLPDIPDMNVNREGGGENPFDRKIRGADATTVIMKPRLSAVYHEMARDELVALCAHRLDKYAAYLGIKSVDAYVQQHAPRKGLNLNMRYQVCGGLSSVTVCSSCGVCV